MIDQFQDKGGYVARRLLKLHDVPAIVKSAADRHDQLGLSAKPPESLPANLYADSHRRLFPCHTAGDVCLSALYFYSQKDQLKQAEAGVIEPRLLKAAEFFGVRGQVDQLRQKIAAAASDSLDDLPDDAFAYVAEYDSGVKHRHLPLRNDAELKAAAAYLREHYPAFSYADRQKVAQRILKQASALRADPFSADEEEYLHKQAAAGTGPGRQVTEMLYKRAQALVLLDKDPDGQEQLIKLAMASNADPALFRRPHMRQKVAELIELIDREHGFDQDLFGRPEDLFSITEKAAAAHVSEHVQLATGSVYKRADLASLRLDDLRGLLGEAFADSVSVGGILLDADKLAKQAAALPADGARLVETLTRAADIKPVFREVPGRPLPALAKLAARHRR